MAKRFFSFVVLMVLVVQTWADVAAIDTRKLWTFDSYSSQTAAVYDYQQLCLHGGAVFSTDATHAKALSGTFDGTSQTWEATQILTASQGALVTGLGNISVSSAEGPAGSLAFSYSVAGSLYIVFGATTATDGTFTVSGKSTGATTYTTLTEVTMPGMAYDGPLATPKKRSDENYHFTLQQARVDLTEAGSVYLAGSQPYCIYALLFVPREISVIDFATAFEHGEVLEKGDEIRVYYYGKSSAQKFNVITNNSNILPIDGKISIEAASGDLTIDGLKASKRHLAIHNLAVGDQIIVRYANGNFTYKGHATHGNRVSINGQTLVANDEVPAGAVITVESVDTDNNYAVFYLDNTCVISGIFINHVEVDKVWAPTLSDKNKNLVEITAGRSAMGQPVSTCYTTDGSDPSLTNGTFGPYNTFEVEVQDHNGIFEVKAISFTDEGIVSVQNHVIIYVSNIPTATSDGKSTVEVPEIIYEQPEPAITAETVRYYISPSGDDKNDGLSELTPFATLGAAQQLVKAGDVVYILPGTYAVTAKEISKEESTGNYKIIFDLSKSGDYGKPISYIGVLDEEGNRPVFDLSRVNPVGYRVTGFLVSGSYLLLRNFEVIGIRVNITDHTQSENIRISDGCHNTLENIACHDGMGIGFYLNKNSAYNLLVNCDGYNNYDYISEEGAGDQNDAFGCHVKTNCPNNMFIGCRAWNNADDGFDLISCDSPVSFSYSIAYNNGYDADGKARHDGNGFKAGGYGMSSAVTEVTPDDVPMHEVHHCLAVSNRSNGIYSNHHLGGVWFHDNTSYKNSRYNYSFVNRKGFTDSEDDLVDVNGYGHVIENNLSVTDGIKNNHVTMLDGGDGQNTLTNNSFVWSDENRWDNGRYGTSLFLSTKNSDLTAARDQNGMLSAATRSYLYQREWLGFGCLFDGYLDAVNAAREVSGHQSLDIADGREATTIQSSELKVQNSLSENVALQSKYYNLQGVEVKHPSKGLYIVNGRKMIVR